MFVYTIIQKTETCDTKTVTIIIMCITDDWLDRTTITKLKVINDEQYNICVSK